MMSAVDPTSVPGPRGPADARTALEILLARQQIHDCIQRYCAGVDRHDVALMLSAFHPDAIDEHGPFRGDPEGFTRWANGFHGDVCVTHTHALSTHVASVDGEHATAVSYAVYGLRRRDGHGGGVACGCAAYHDRFERREGLWRIAHRKVHIEWRGALPLNMPQGYPQGRWDRDDPLYTWADQ